jgi:hypothetical protein
MASMVNFTLRISYYDFLKNECPGCSTSQDNGFVYWLRAFLAPPSTPTQTPYPPASTIWLQSAWPAACAVNGVPRHWGLLPGLAQLGPTLPRGVCSGLLQGVKTRSRWAEAGIVLPPMWPGDARLRHLDTVPSAFQPSQSMSIVLLSCSRLVSRDRLSSLHDGFWGPSLILLAQDRWTQHCVLWHHCLHVEEWAEATVCRIPEAPLMTAPGMCETAYQPAHPQHNWPLFKVIFTLWYTLIFLKLEHLELRVKCPNLSLFFLASQMKSEAFPSCHMETYSCDLLRDLYPVPLTNMCLSNNCTWSWQM